MNSKSLDTIFRKPVHAINALLLCALFLAACAPVVAANPAPTATIAPTPVAANEATISVATDAKLGNILVGDNGMTLYVFTKDEPNQSNCNSNCLAKWPPLLTQGNPKLGEGVDASLIGTASLADGSKIVTYNKMPLYYWYEDAKAGDTDGQGVGGVWFVISPDGKVVGNEVPAAAPATAPIVAPTTAPVVAPTTAPVATPTPVVASEPTISIAKDPRLGKFLVGENGMTLYIFTKDEANKSNCNPDCLAKWPPLLTQENPKLGEGVDASLIGTASLADGWKIVTYNKMPLYYWYEDAKAGDTNGLGIGGVWFVISPAGKVIGVPSSPSDDSGYSDGY
jgi:predicted lipoprotein with Yx(FWY)xxD motif